EHDLHLWLDCLALQPVLDRLAYRLYRSSSCLDAPCVRNVNAAVFLNDNLQRRLAVLSRSEDAVLRRFPDIYDQPIPNTHGQCSGPAQVATEFLGEGERRERVDRAEGVCAKGNHDVTVRNLS